MDASPQRPMSALARGVQITEYTDSRVNPDPIVVEESDVLLEEYLSPRKLVRIFMFKFFICHFSCVQKVCLSLLI